MAAAFQKVTGLPVNPPDDWKIDTAGFIVTTSRKPSSRRHLFKAERLISDSSGRVMAAVAHTEDTSVGAMVAAMRKADRDAGVLAAVSDRLTEDGWEVDPMIAGTDSGITAHRAWIAIMICGDGKVVCSDLTAAIYAESVVKVVNGEMP
jgi:hypothetical protein